MSEPLTDDEREQLEQLLYELKLEHRDMDVIVRRLSEGPSTDELQLKRFKKKKLHLKERIAMVNDRLIPDMEA